jgi:hypothetical protein
MFCQEAKEQELMTGPMIQIGNLLIHSEWSRATKWTGSSVSNWVKKKTYLRSILLQKV